MYHPLHHALHHFGSPQIFVFTFQANGLDERYNQTLVNALSKFSHECRESWDEHLAEVVYSYNTAVQESTRHTPFEVMFGRKGNLPIDFNTVTNYNPDEKLMEFVQVCCTKVYSIL